MTTENFHQLGQGAGGGDTYVAPTELGVPASQLAAADPFSGYENYYAFSQTEKWYFPDGKQWIEFKKMTEGERARFLQETRSDIHMNQKTGEARFSVDQSRDRKALLLQSIVDWHLVSFVTGRPQLVPFQPGHSKGGVISQWIERADPSVLAGLEKAIRKVNPWLLAEMTVEQIDKEIADLQELREKAAEREAEEGNFAAK